jgi:hypothetical protein
MFGQLPKLFDRDFAIGHFLPLSVFLFVSLQVPRAFGIEFDPRAATDTQLVVGTTLLGLAAWLGAIFLMANNLLLYQVLEGYGRWNPIGIFGPLQRSRFRRLQKRIQKLNDEYQHHLSHKLSFPSQKALERAELMRVATETFPDDEEWLLPTAFGNAIRGFEVYSRVVYGMEAIQGWPRLFAVLPKEFSAAIDTAKALTDLWVNFFFLSLLLVVEWLVLAIYEQRVSQSWVPVAGIAVAAFSSYSATKAATQWGELVKSAFDVFLPTLRSKLGFSTPATIADEQALWRSFSKAVLFRQPNNMPDRSAHVATSQGAERDTSKSDEDDDDEGEDERTGGSE